MNEFVMQASSWEELQLAVESRVMSAEQVIGLEKGSCKGLNYSYYHCLMIYVACSSQALILQLPSKRACALVAYQTTH